MSYCWDKISSGRQLPENAKIAIFGHYGNQNIGDEAIIVAVIENIKLRLPNARLYGFSINPQDTAQRYNIPTFPIRRIKRKNENPVNQAQGNGIQKSHGKSVYVQGNFGKIKEWLKGVRPLYLILKLVRYLLIKGVGFFGEIAFTMKSYRILKHFDLLLITGSNQFLDNFGGPWGYPYTLLKWSILAKLARIKVFFVSVGAGPISSKLSKLFIRWSLLFSDYTSFRDEASKQLINSIGFHGEGYVYPDLAHSLFMDGEKKDDRLHFISTRRPIVGINPMPLYDFRYWCDEDSSKYNDYVRKLARFSSTLVREGYPIFFFGTQLKDESVARDVFENLDRDLIGSLKMEELLMKSRSVSGLMKLLSTADIIVATRFHGTILSLIAGIPVLAICYYRKTKDIMKEMDQENYSVPFEKLEVPDMIMRFKILETNRVHEAKKIYKKNEEYRNLLKEQYDLLFGSVRSSSDEHQISSMTFV